MLRFAEELERHSKIGIEQTCQPLHWRASRALRNSVPLSHLVAEIFKDGQKHCSFVLKMQVYGALRHLRGECDIVDGSLAITVLCKQFKSRHQDGIALGRSALPQVRNFFLNLFHESPIQGY